MPAVWVGASLILVGLVSLAVSSLWQGRLGGTSGHPPETPRTLEPDEPDIGFDLENNPGLALIAMGAILLLGGLFKLWEESLIPDPA